MQQKKIVAFEFFKILKCVTKRECVTSRVRKDARGYCINHVKMQVLKKELTLVIIMDSIKLKW